MDFVTFFPGFSGAKVRVGYTSVVVINENYNKYMFFALPFAPRAIGGKKKNNDSFRKTCQSRKKILRDCLQWSEERKMSNPSAVVLETPAHQPQQVNIKQGIVS